MRSLRYRSGQSSLGPSRPWKGQSSAWKRFCTGTWVHLVGDGGNVGTPRGAVGAREFMCWFHLLALMGILSILMGGEGDPCRMWAEEDRWSSRQDPLVSLGASSAPSCLLHSFASPLGFFSPFLLSASLLRLSFSSFPRPVPLLVSGNSMTATLVGMGRQGDVAVGTVSHQSEQTAVSVLSVGAD